MMQQTRWPSPFVLPIIDGDNALMQELTQFIIERGIPTDTVILILMLPVVATLIAAAREIIGIKGFGIYTSLIISFAFVRTGLTYGILIFILVLLTGTFLRFVIKQARILYLPRMAIILTGVAFAIFLLFFWAAFFRQNDFIIQAEFFIFPIIIMITLVEKFIAAQIERGEGSAVILTLETLGLALLSYGVIHFPLLRELVLRWPLGIFATAIFINILIGKWTGLRITEYFRFRDLIRSMEASSPKK